jgi:hypothetical protein
VSSISSAADAALHAEAAGFFDAFVEAFASFDGERIARRYLAPYLSRRADGTSACFLTHEEIGRYFQSVVDGYRRDGCASCRWDALESVGMGPQGLLATVTWTLLRADGSVLAEWRESYHLARTPEGLRVLASVDHAMAPAAAA